MDQKSKSQKTAAITILTIFLFLFFTGLHGFVFLQNGKSTRGIWSYSAIAFLAACITFLFYRIYRATLRKCMIFKMKRLLLSIGILLLVTLILIILEAFTGSISLVDGKTIQLWLFCFEKRWLFDLWMLLLFPAFAILSARALKRKNTRENRTAAWLILLSLSTAGFLIFQKMGAVWLAELAAINTATVSGICLSAPSKEAAPKKSRHIRSCVLYACYWSVLILTRVPAGHVIDFLYGEGSEQRRQYMISLIYHASLWGLPGRQADTAAIQEGLLDKSSNPLHTLLFYGGWGCVLIYLLVLAVFLILLYDFLGRKYRAYKPFYLIYKAAWGNLLIRSLCGVLYSFALPACPISLPFAGKVGLVTDSICMALLLYSAIENRQIRMVLSQLTGLKVKKLPLCPVNAKEYRITFPNKDTPDFCILSNVFWEIPACFLTSVYVARRQIGVYKPAESMENEVIFIEAKKVSVKNRIRSYRYEVVTDDALALRVLHAYKREVVELRLGEDCQEEFNAFLNI